jgi:hypothetical protein
MALERSGGNGHRIPLIFIQITAIVEWVAFLAWTPKPEPMLMRASQPARLGKEKPHEGQTP